MIGVLLGSALPGGYHHRQCPSLINTDKSAYKIVEKNAILATPGIAITFLCFLQ